MESIRNTIDNDSLYREENNIRSNELGNRYRKEITHTNHTTIVQPLRADDNEHQGMAPTLDFCNQYA